MTDQANRTVWWTCYRCNAHVAISAVVFVPIEPPITHSRRAFYKYQPGEVWKTHLLVSGDGLAMYKPKYCPCCGVETVSNDGERVKRPETEVEDRV